jgi:RNA polymerase sigma-70 factor (ECF subfamily)
MGEKDRVSLLRHLVARYEDLARKLTPRLGSTGEAADALQDTYLRIGQAEAIPAVHDPHAYLLRVATNIAADRRRAHVRQRLDDIDIARLLEIEDDAPDPAAILAGRQDMALLQASLHELPVRRRAIFLAARVEGLPHREIADRFGISLRTVANEIQRAFDHCARSLDKCGT